MEGPVATNTYVKNLARVNGCGHIKVRGSVPLYEITQQQPGLVTRQTRSPSKCQASVGLVGTPGGPHYLNGVPTGTDFTAIFRDAHCAFSPSSMRH